MVLQFVYTETLFHWCFDILFNIHQSCTKFGVGATNKQTAKIFIILACMEPSN